MSVRPFRLWPATTLKHVSHRLAAPWQAWCGDWGLECTLGAAAACTGEGMDEDEGICWHGCLRLASGTLWLGWNAAMATALSAQLYPGDGGGQHCGGGIAAAAGAACLDGLLATLAEALQADIAAVAGAAPSNAAWQPGSGAVALGSAAGAGRLAILLDDAAVAGLAPPSRTADLPAIRRTAPDALVGGVMIPMRVGTGKASLSLADIAGLAQGDVITFDTRLDQPFEVHGPSGAPVCGARLLRDGDQCIFAITQH